MSLSVPSEDAIAREIAETGLGRLPCIRRIQQRESLRRKACGRLV